MSNSNLVHVDALQWPRAARPSTKVWAVLSSSYSQLTLSGFGHTLMSKGSAQASGQDRIPGFEYQLVMLVVPSEV